MVLSKKTKILTIFALTGSILGSTLTLPATQTVFAAETQNQITFLTENDLKDTVKRAMPSFLDKNKPYGLKDNDFKVIPNEVIDLWYSIPEIKEAIFKEVFRPAYETYVGLSGVQVASSQSIVGPLRKSGKPELISAGISELENTDSQNTRNLVSASFSKAFTSSSTVSVTNGVNLGYKLSTKIELPIIGGVNTEFSHNINWSVTDATTSSSTDTYTAPQQTIAVPPRSKAIVTYILQTQSYVGDIELKGDLTGSMKLNNPIYVYAPDTPDSQKVMYSNTLYNIFDKSGIQLPRGLSLDSNNQKIKFNGLAQVKVDVGLNYLVKVEIVSLDNPKQIIKEYEKEVIAAKSQKGSVAKLKKIDR
ncbi:ETX/MTX2 family pore-forming toxin, partial [Bacillus cereus]